MTDDEKYNHYIQNDSPNVRRRFRNKGKVPDMAAKDGKPIPGKSSLIGEPARPAWLHVSRRDMESTYAHMSGYAYI